MKRLLCIVSLMGTGGAETFLMKVYRELDKTKYQMDFAVSSNEEGFYDKEIESIGGKIYHIGIKKDGFIKNFKSIYSIVKEGNYNYVLKSSQLSLAGIDLFAAKLAGAKVRVYRSSNAGSIITNMKERICQSVFSFIPRCVANVKIAPSTEAAEYVFGKGCIKKGKASILLNGLDLETYRFSLEERNKIRKELSIENKKVIGHIGRFNKQKNHDFLIDIFKEMHILDPNTVLILGGVGELEEDIKKKVNEYKLDNDVLFLGTRKDIPQLLSAMDIFVFPSFFEGMPNIILEAQATGLNCLISDNITKEAKICNNVQYLSLNEPPKQWAIQALSLKKEERENKYKELIEAGYDISNTKERFIELIFDKQ